jgi:hypothetical protein
MVNLNIYSSNTSNASAKLTLQELNTSNITLSYPNDIISIPSVSSVQIPGTTDEYMVFNYTGDNTNTVGQTVYNISIPENYSADILMVGGGGGGGGDVGGGGGGGAVLYGSNIIIPAGSYNIKVGAGGTGRGVNGYNTEAFGSVCLGGGAAKNKAMYPSIPNDSNLLAWYRFNGDTLDYNPTSTKYDFVTDAGTVSYPAELLQGRKYINTASGSLKNTTIVLRQRAFSVSMWFRFKTTLLHTIMAQSITQTQNTTLYIGQWGNGSYFLAFHANDLTAGTGTGTPSSYPGDINTWVHLAFVVEANYNRKIYRNGVLIAFDNNTSAFTGTGDLEFFKPYWNSNSYHNADISDLRIYGVAISATDVATLYSSYINGGITDNSAGSNAGSNGGSGAGGRTVNTTANGSFGAGGTVGTSTKSSLLTTATLYQGSSGGTGVTATTGSTNYILSGGGGGATAVGTAGKSAASTAGTGTGGDGVPLNITGTTFWWGAGGGAGGYATAAGNGGRGGAGGGTSSGTGGTNGTVGANGFNAASGLNAGYGTGSGGGGGNIITTMSGGTGGSGVVIMRYRRLNEGTPEIYFLREKLTMSGYTNYKIGNYNGDFQIKSSTSNIDRAALVIQNGGNVGIGTSAPINNLHIYSSNNANASSKLTIQELNTSNYALTYPNDIATYPFVPSISVSGTIDKYMIFTYTSDTTGAGQTQYSINVPETYSCDILMIGGGGSGGIVDAGGGGAGACIVAINQVLNAGNYSINVGNGGIGGAINSSSVITQYSTNGANTTITNSSGTEIYRAVGGGRAGGGEGSWIQAEYVGKIGGSGGGAGFWQGNSGLSGGTASSLNIVNGINNISPSVTTTYGVYGNIGGSAQQWTNANYSTANAGGGGGIGTAGSSGIASTNRSGVGGNGLAEVTINSTLINFKKYFAPNWENFGVLSGGLYYIGGGGGGGGFSNSSAKVSGGLGGGGIGDNAGNNATFTDAPTNGLANTGSGGGGAAGNAGANGGNGGSGIVIIRYRKITERGNPEIQLISGNSLLTTYPFVPSISVSGTIDNYMVFTYTSDTTGAGQTQYSINVPETYSCDILVVGGGGAGGSRIGGGGGAGALIYVTNQTLSIGQYSIIVGRGGVGISTSSQNIGEIGKDSEIFFNTSQLLYRAKGGGGGDGNALAGTTNIALVAGGSSGGVGANFNNGANNYISSGASPLSTNTITINAITTTIAPNNTSVYGYSGGGGYIFDSRYMSGGGGGAGSVGQSINTTAFVKAGDGGNAISISISGSSVAYAGGGGAGGGRLIANKFCEPGLGGSVNSIRVGGNGGYLKAATTLNGIAYPAEGVGGDAVANTGSGGGGSGSDDIAQGTYSYYKGGNGGSGIVIIRYRRATNNYKIGNYNGDFKFKSSTSNIDIDKFTIQGNGNIVINETLGNETKLTIQNTRQNNEVISTPSITTSLIPTSTDRFMAFPYTTDTAALGQTNYTISMTSGFYDILMVGGGGAGGQDIGGGGGGAAVLYATNVFITTGSYVIKVGRGATPGETRGKSTEGFGAVILGGGSANNSGWDPPSSLGNGNSGGSGGGGKGKQSGYSTVGGKSGISPIGTIFGNSYTIYNGNNGGAGLTQGTGGTKVAGGGGGGAGGIGADPTSATGKGGDGGDGVPINITGVTYWWGAGGGGDTEGINNTIPGGNGGKGGGGAGDGSQAGVIGQTINGNVGTNGYGIASGKNAGSGTGSGGGGARYLNPVSGNGGSGIIIIRYRSGNSSIELIRGAIGDNNTEYKIGNYGGDFKIISSSASTDTDRVIINSAGYLLINGFKQPFSRCGSVINNPNFIDIPVLFDITNTNVHTCEIKLHWMTGSSGGPMTILGIGSLSGTGSLITPSETSYKTTGQTTEVTTIVSGNVLANTIIASYDATTSIRICNSSISTGRRHHYICESVYAISNIGASQTIAKGYIGITPATNGSLSFIRLNLATNFTYGDWTATYYHI